MIAYMMRQLLSAIFLFTFCQASAQPRYKTIVSNGEKDIIPEGIAVDEATGIIYVGSMAKNKIIIIDTMGKAKDFVVVNARREGLTDVSGIKVDKKRRWIWVVSTVINGKQYATYLKAFEISTGKFKKSF